LPSSSIISIVTVDATEIATDKTTNISLLDTIVLPFLKKLKDFTMLRVAAIIVAVFVSINQIGNNL
jgi:uncharacterized membrane protein (DUF106 family)